MKTITNEKSHAISSFLKKDWEITTRKIRIGSWLTCLIIYLFIYWMDNESFSEFFSGLNIFTSVLLTSLITESIVFLYRRVRKKSKSGLGVVLSSIFGVAMGIGLTIVVCFILFWGLMFIAYS